MQRTTWQLRKPEVYLCMTCFLHLRLSSSTSGFCLILCRPEMNSVKSPAVIHSRTSSSAGNWNWDPGNELRANNFCWQLWSKSLKWLLSDKLPLSAKEFLSTRDNAARNKAPFFFIPSSVKMREMSAFISAQLTTPGMQYCCC